VKLFLHAALIALVSPAALAASNTLEMTCQQSNALVTARGAVILRTGGSYARYVSKGTFCDAGLSPFPSWVPTKDSAECYVGFICETGSSNN
jgi:hypothetical protein